MRAWQSGLLSGVLFGGWTYVFGVDGMDTAGPAAAGIALMAGAFFGVAMGFYVAHTQRQIFGTLPRERRTEVIAAVNEVRPPHDPDLREAADNLAGRWASGRNSPLAAVVMFGLLLVVSVVAGITGSRWGWFAAAAVVLVPPYPLLRDFRRRDRARRYLAT